jgi:UMF1 family MFS transporter
MATDVIDPSTGEGAAASTRRERVGWYFYDWANSAFYTTVVAVFLGKYLTSVAEHAADAAGFVHPLGLTVRAGSVYPYALSLSVALQVVVLPVVGAVADRSHRKKQLLALFAYVGSAATAGLLFVTGGRYLLGAVLFLVANIAFGASVVVYNSFLPQLAGADQRDRVSSIGWAIGYVGGALLLVLNLVALVSKGALGLSTADVARYSMVSAGLWWAGFTTIPLLRLRNRPATAGEHRGPALTDGFRQLGRTLKSLWAYPLTLFFLVAYLIYNDGIQTVIGLAGQYGGVALGLSDQVLVSTILVVNLLGIAGALALGQLARRIGAWKTVLASLVLWTVMVGLAYQLPAKQVVPFVALGGAIGVVLGGSQALSRSLFSQLVPAGKEGEYFGLYEISDKGTSWFGPLLFGLTFDATGSYRYAIISLVAFFVVGFVLLLLVPMRRAIVAAGNIPPKRL